MSKLAKIAKKLLDKGEVKLAREVLSGVRTAKVPEELLSAFKNLSSVLILHTDPRQVQLLDEEGLKQLENYHSSVERAYKELRQAFDEARITTRTDMLPATANDDEDLKKILEDIPAGKYKISAPEPRDTYSIFYKGSSGGIKWRSQTPRSIERVVPLMKEALGYPLIITVTRAGDPITFLRNS